jgi:hypothetical protein
MSLEDAVAAAWTTAADDLGIAVSTHGVLYDADGNAHSYTVHVPDFGSPKGTVCVVASPGGDTLSTVICRLAVEQGFHFAGFYDADRTYERAVFIDTLNDWQWFGDADPPEWYTGKPWAPPPEPRSSSEQERPRLPMKEVLMGIVEEFAAFVTLNKPDDLKPEVAKWGMTRLQERLSELDGPQRAALVAYLERSAEESEGYYAVFAAELPDVLGLR